MKTLTTIIQAALLCSVVFAQTANPQPPRPVTRQVQGGTLISKELPAAKFTFGKEFRYIGGQIVNLYGNADAEQHLFVQAGSSGPVVRFYWVQFEHFLPSNNHTYDYSPDHTARIGDLQFIYDVKSFADYATLELDDPASDGAAIRKLLSTHNLTLPQKTVRVRMFHLPTADHRTELMIIYGETLPENSHIPAPADGVSLDDTFHDFASTVLEHARSGVTITQ